MDLYSENVNIAKIRDGLFMGDIIAGTTLDIVFEFKISHMINTCSSQVPSQFQSIGVKYLNLAWPEHPSLNLPLIKDDLVNKIVNFIDGCLRNGDGLMIYSYKGQNRCCAVILIYLMKKYFWSLQKSKEYLLCKKQDMKLSKNILEHLIAYENHLHKIYPNKLKSTTWATANLKDGEELLMANTYLNEVEISKKKIFVQQIKKDNNKHIGWADDKNNDKNYDPDKKLVNYNIEDDLFLKKNVKDITCHLTKQELKSIIKKNSKENTNDYTKTENSKDNISKITDKEKIEFYETKNLLLLNNNNQENNSKIIIENKDKDNKENENININLISQRDKESINEINVSNQIIDSSNKKQSTKMKLNILKNIPPKDLNGQIIYNTGGGEDQKLKLDFPLKDFNNNKLKNNQNYNINNMNLNFNDINIPNFNQKYINNFIENNDQNIKSGNSYSLYLKNKGNKKSRSNSKHNNNNNIMPFIDYNQNNNIITNFMLNHNNNQKLFVKFNKNIQRDSPDINNIINNNNQFIQNNNFININYYPQPNEGKYIYNIYPNIIFLLYYRTNTRNK